MSESLKNELWIDLKRKRIFISNNEINEEQIDCSMENMCNGTNLNNIKSSDFEVEIKPEPNNKQSVLSEQKCSFETMKAEDVSLVSSSLSNTELKSECQDTTNLSGIKQEKPDEDVDAWNSLIGEKTENLYIDSQEIVLKEYKIESPNDGELEDNFVEIKTNLNLKSENELDLDRVKEEEEDNKDESCKTQPENGTSEDRRSKYKCDQCPYHSKYISNFKEHQMTHKDLSERTVYECEHCDLKFVSRKGLKMHSLRHKKPSERPLLSCESCDFTTMHKSSLTSHKLGHKDSSAVATLKCGSCAYETRYRSHFNRHIKNRHPEKYVTPEKKLYECELCDAKLVTLNNFERHVSMHKDSFDKKKFQCDVCGYKCERKFSLKQHKLRHLPKSEVNTLKCDSCDYSSKYKWGLIQHFKQFHVKLVPGAESYDCDQCGVKLATKTSLRMHLLKHKQDSDGTKFSCNVCEYKSIYKSSVKRHKAKVHSDFSELVLTCSSCEFATEYKCTLEKHFKMHHKA